MSTVVSTSMPVPVVIEQARSVAVTAGGETVVVTQQLVDRFVVITRGIPGPAGPPGPPGSGGAQYIELPAGEAIGGHRVVYGRDGEVFHASSDDTESASAVIGISLGAAAVGTTAQILVAGLVAESSWNWLPSKPIFLGLNGVLTQTPPAAGVSLVIGVPTASNSMSINVQMPITL